MTIERKGRWLFAVNAIINWLISIRGIVVFMFGCMFWEVSRQPARKHSLAKYNWIEKTITATAVTVGYFSGQAPLRLMVLIVLTNWLWIPIILAYDLAQSQAIRDSVRRAREADSFSS